MKNFKKLLAQAEKLTKGDPEQFASGIQNLVQSEAFQTMRQEWLSPTERPSDPVCPAYEEEIAEYTLKAIGLYAEAIPHHAIESIELCFDRDPACLEIQPQIGIQFDTGRYQIDIGMFWDDEIGLKRKGKKECQTMAESVWPAFKGRGEHLQEKIPPLAEAVRQAVAERYPSADVTSRIH